MLNMFRRDKIVENAERYSTQTNVARV